MSPDDGTTGHALRSERAGDRLVGLAWIPLTLFATAMVIIYAQDLTAVYQPAWALPIMNAVVFVGATVVAATLAGRGFVESGSSTLLFLGSGSLTFGAASVVGSLLISVQSVNAGVTAQSVAWLVASMFYAASVALVLRQPAIDRHRGAIVVALYSGALTIVALVVWAAVDGLFPPFIGAAGSEPIRSATLLLTAATCLATSTLFGMQAWRTGVNFLWWYAYGLGLIVIGIVGVALGMPGTALNWTGRVAQAMGQLYILACLAAAILEMPASSAIPGTLIGRSFRRLEDALRASESRYRKLFMGLNDAFGLHKIILDPSGRPIDYIYLDVNEPFEQLMNVDAADVVGRRASDVLPRAFDDASELVRRFGEVALTGRPARFEAHSTALGRWLSVSVYSPEPGHFVTLLDDITERKRAEQRRELYVGSLVRLLDLSTEVLSATEVSQMLERVSEATGELIGARVALAGYDYRVGVFRANARSVAPDADCDHEGLASWIASKDVFGTLTSQPSVRQSAAMLSLRDDWPASACPGPLLAARMTTRDGRPVGILAVADKPDGEFGEADELMLRHLASIGSLGIEQLKAFQRERRIADTLQEAILAPPDPIPELTVSYLYRPASRAANVGGDFYDVFRIGDHHVGVLIGDVSGKGLDAARLTSLVKDSLRAYANLSLDPQVVVSQVNALIYSMSSVESYATLSFAVLDLHTGEGRYCNGGHTTGVLLRAGAIVRLLESTGGLVGAMPNMEYAADSFGFRGGDRLVLYTDGILEARRNGELFGMSRVLDALDETRGAPVDEVPGGLLERVLAFTGGELNDDVVVLCVEAEG